MVTTVAIPTTYSVPTPVQYNLATDYARFGLEKWQVDEILASRFTNRNGGKPRFIVLHIQDGITTGSLDWWSSDAVDASSSAMAQKDGSLLHIIPDQHGPWTNGDVRSPTVEASEIIALGGNPNNWSLTMEAEGRPWDVMPEAQRNAIVWWAEDKIMKYPEILNSTWSFLRHRFINSVSRWNCPDSDSDPAKSGPYFDPVVADINLWLAGPVIPPVEPPSPEPVSPYPPGMTLELAKRLYGQVTVPWSSKTFEFHEERSECQYWLARGKLSMTDPDDWSSGQWPELDDVIRRGKTKNIHIYRWNNGDVYEKVIRKDQ